MKFVKIVTLSLLALLLTGCYTQLEYSQSMKKITDEKERSADTPAYSWNGEEKVEARDETEEQQEAEDYVPIYYKDYEYAQRYDDCKCSPYNVYNFYGNDWYGYDYYGPYSGYSPFYSWHPFYYDRWAFHSMYGRWYDRPHYGFSITLSWGWPHYSYGFYDPFYAPYYDYYWYRYYSRYAYGYYYGKSGYGPGYYPDKKIRDNKNVRYGPRSIGTNRVDTDRNRSRSVNGERSATVTNRTSPTVRTRSTGTVRTRGTSSTERSRTDRARGNRGNSRDVQQDRSRDNLRDSNVSIRDYSPRNRDGELPVVIDEKQLKEIRSRINSRNSFNDRARVSSPDRRKSIFFDRIRTFFRNNSGSFSIGNDNRTVRTRSIFRSNNGSRIDRNRSSSGSSVTRSKSSSTNSRSRGSSSSSRSRSGSSNSDNGSDRSRGN